MEYKTLRAVSATADTGLTATTAKYSDVAADIVPLGSSEQLGSASIIFKGTDATAETANWALYAIRDVDAAPEFVAHGTATLGATETGEDGDYYANTIVVTKESWLRPVEVTAGYQWNITTPGAVANGGIAKLSFDGMEYKYFLLQMTKGTCATCGADYTLTY